MFTVVLRALIVFVVLIAGVRLMGKRTIGELQPYEFVITLAVADLACTPMQDVSVPLLYGIIPILVLFVVHYLLTILTTKSMRFRKFLNGKPFIVIDSDGINSECLTKLNLSVNNLLALIRQQGYFSIPEISYGIIETNGKLSLLKNENAEAPSSIPMTLVVEGKIMNENAEMMNIDTQKIKSILSDRLLSVKDTVLMTAESGKIFIQPKRAKYMTLEADL
ncbi:MAG: DUF421 domain-containing protein [Clostridia bacterium]|nr:DUF421 domain-containing protein [Clostridia bacterium]